MFRVLSFLSCFEVVKTNPAYRVLLGVGTLRERPAPPGLLCSEDVDLETVHAQIVLPSADPVTLDVVVAKPRVIDDIADVSLSKVAVVGGKRHVVADRPRIHDATATHDRAG
jgi:hypothetical protein